MNHIIMPLLSLLLPSFRMALLAYCMVSGLGATEGLAIAQAATLESLKCNTKGAAQVVQSLYDNYPFGGRRAIHVEPKAVLSQYFDGKLTGLILKNQVCERKEQGICSISSNVLYHSQDAEITDLKICAASTDSDAVEVRFKNIGTAERVIYKLAKVNGEWRISNILYQDGTSLIQLLSGQEINGVTH